MISRILAIIVARTNLIRNMATALVGALLAAGIIDDAGGAEVLAGLVVLLTGLASYLIEHTKARHVREVQEEIAQDEPIKVDGYFGPKTKRAIYKRVRGAGR
jgi:peptidoglycan hydrolase-like protein with peptidoglycan-binding domain